MRVLALLFWLAVATFSADTPAANPPAAKVALSDSQIEAGIRARLARSKIGQDGFTVRVRNRVAYWEGRTAVVQHKGAATRMAKAAGAHSVVNNIQISTSAPRRAQIKSRP